MLARLLKHLFADAASVTRVLPPASMQAIEACIAANEQRHDGELRFVVEAGLPVSELFARRSARERAIDVFGQLRIWDTEQNSGVLIYLLLADHDVEIVADRGIDREVGAAAWEAICVGMQREFAAGRFEQGVMRGIQAISDLLAAHYPPIERNVDELTNRPVVL